MVKQTLKILVLILIFGTGSVFAKDVKVSVKLDRIKAVSLSEERGDEIYFSITAYPSEKVPGTSSRVPAFPLHWLAKNLNNVRDIVMWQDSIKQGSAVQLVISLVEQDLPPWNIDDHLGSVKLFLANNNGVLDAKWEMPDYNDNTKVRRSSESNQAPKFTFRGEGAEYQAQFIVAEE